MTSVVAIAPAEAAITVFAIAAAAAAALAVTGPSAARRRILHVLRLPPRDTPAASRSGDRTTQRPGDRASWAPVDRPPHRRRWAVRRFGTGQPGHRTARRGTVPWSAPALRRAALLTSAIGALAGALGPAPALGCPLLGLAGYRLPAAAADRQARARRQALHAALPETGDLLAVSMNAGLNVALALRRAVLHAPEPMRSELARVDGETALGRPLREALGALADRTGSDEVRALVSILGGGDRLGTSVAESIEQWAGDLWMRRRHELEAEARRAPVKILFPLVFLILPAFLLTTVVPLLLSTLRALGHGP